MHDPLGDHVILGQVRGVRGDSLWRVGRGADGGGGGLQVGEGGAAVEV